MWSQERIFITKNLDLGHRKDKTEGFGHHSAVKKGISLPKENPLKL